MWMSVSAYKVNIYVANLARVFTGPQTLYGSFEFGILLVCFYEYLKPYLCLTWLQNDLASPVKFYFLLESIYVFNTIFQYKINQVFLFLSYPVFLFWVPFQEQVKSKYQ